jgi:hypothetical protein
MNPSSPAAWLLFDAAHRARQRMQPAVLQAPRRRLAASPRLAKRSHALYVGEVEHFELAGVVRRDQNVSHLIVFGPKDASLLAR